MKKERWITVAYFIHIPIDILKECEGIKSIVEKLESGKKVPRRDINKVKETIYEIAEDVRTSCSLDPEIVESDLPYIE